MLEVSCQNSTNYVTELASAKAEDVGTVAASCRRRQTKAHLYALLNTLVRDAMVAKMLSKMLWLLVGAATIGVTGEHLRTTKKLVRNRISTGRLTALASAPVR